jgi:hypothetical protein
MPNRPTHFEQVPIVEIETVIRQDSESVKLLEKSVTPVPGLKPRVISTIQKHKTNTPSEGPL